MIDEINYMLSEGIAKKQKHNIALFDAREQQGNS